MVFFILFALTYSLSNPLVFMKTMLPDISKSSLSPVALIGIGSFCYMILLFKELHKYCYSPHIFNTYFCMGLYRSIAYIFKGTFYSCSALAKSAHRLLSKGIAMLLLLYHIPLGNTRYQYFTCFFTSILAYSKFVMLLHICCCYITCSYNCS